MALAYSMALAWAALTGLGTPIGQRDLACKDRCLYPHSQRRVVKSSRRPGKVAREPWRLVWCLNHGLMSQAHELRGVNTDLVPLAV